MARSVCSKKYRDAVIHARIIDQKAGVGELIESKGRHIEVLLTADTLNALHDHINTLRPELATLLTALLHAEILSEMPPDDPERSLCAAKLQVCFAQAQSHRTQRLSHPPIPGFPPEEQLKKLGSPAQEVQVGMLAAVIPT